MTELSRNEKISKIYEVIADKTFSIGCIFKFVDEKENARFGNMLLYKYVRHLSSSSEGYDSYKIKPGEMSFSDMRSGHIRAITLNTRENVGRMSEDQDEGVNVDDKFIASYFEIIGHPIMLGDFLDWFSSNHDVIGPNWMKKKDEVLYTINQLRGSKRKPIEEQLNDCINFVYSLIKDPCQN